ncbi:GntR family transcriptional regulator [Amycolatopsis pigmentata]|uniref:GntR family transcriptional regulator n=1 Tax=Amycolatopsis pigmentata TaxID=450801 RepID=A0ABW5FWJ2_9PSEU
MDRECDQADERLGTFRIDRTALPYLYRQVAGHIAARIAVGQLPQSEMLSSESALAKEYGVALGTARRAIGLLRQEGLLVTIRSRGTFVVGR